MYSTSQMHVTQFTICILVWFGNNRTANILQGENHNPISSTSVKPSCIIWVYTYIRQQSRKTTCLCSRDYHIIIRREKRRIHWDRKTFISRVIKPFSRPDSLELAINHADACQHNGPMFYIRRLACEYAHWYLAAQRYGAAITGKLETRINQSFLPYLHSE